MFTVPIKRIEKLLKALEKRDKKIATYSSITLSRVAVELGMGKGAIQDYLPFKDESEDDSKPSTKNLTPETLVILKAMIKAKTLPHRIYPVLEPWSDHLFN